MKCFYHLDLDGKCAGYLVWHYACLREEDEKPENFIKINYGMEFPLNKIEKDERVFIVDFSIEPEDMRELLKITKNVVWIDHHKTTIEKYKDFESYIPGIRMTGPGISGASLYGGISTTMLSMMEWKKYKDCSHKKMKIGMKICPLLFY